jgi:hypothetical protein
MQVLTNVLTSNSVPLLNETRLYRKKMSNFDYVVESLSRCIACIFVIFFRQTIIDFQCEFNIWNNMKITGGENTRKQSNTELLVGFELEAMILIHEFTSSYISHAVR